MKKLLLGALAAAALTLGLATSAGAAGLPKCGGQSAALATPYSCYNTNTVDGVLIRVDVHVDGSGNASVLYSLPNGPINRIIGLQIAAHVGLSSSSASHINYDTMPAGADTFPIATTFPATGVQADCRNQFDIKAWPDHQGSPKSWTPNTRISGATFTFTGCTTTIPPTTIAPSVPPVPPSGPGTTTASTPGVPATPGVPSTKPVKVAGCTLDSSGVYVNANGAPCDMPATGTDAWALLYIVVTALLAGFVVQFYGRNKAEA